MPGSEIKCTGIHFGNRISYRKEKRCKIKSAVITKRFFLPFSSFRFLLCDIQSRINACSLCLCNATQCNVCMCTTEIIFYCTTLFFFFSLERKQKENERFFCTVHCIWNMLHILEDLFLLFFLNRIYFHIWNGYTGRFD